MKRRWLKACLAVGVLAVVGCQASDLLFGMLSPHYTDGGTDPFTKRRHYDERVEQWRLAGGFDAATSAAED